MSSGSVASAGKRTQEKSDSPGDEGAGCGTCRRLDYSRMVQCDDCDVWFHYECVNVEDSIRDRDWSCNGCIRKSLEQERRGLREQLEHLEREQKQWQQKQQKHLEQAEEHQRRLEQQQKQNQFNQSQKGKLQLQQGSLSGVVTTRSKAFHSDFQGAIPKQPRQKDEVSENIADRQYSIERSANSNANCTTSTRTSSKATSNVSKRSAKLRDLQLKALEARQALEKKQLEERLALDLEMLEMSDSESATNETCAKIEDWLNNTENIGKEVFKPFDETPLPVYDELLRKSVVVSTRESLPSNYVPVVVSGLQTSFGNSVPPEFHNNYASGVGDIDRPLPGVTVTRTVPGYQPLFTSHPAAVPPSLPPFQTYSAVSQQSIMTATHPTTCYSRPTASYPHPVVPSFQYPVPTYQGTVLPPVVTSTPRQNVTFNHQQLNGDDVPLNNGHLAARQTVKDLPKFGGDPEDWPRFIAAYERTCRMCGFRNDELLDRLERSLYDKALNAVKSLLLHPDNVPVIISRLKTLFGNPESIVETMVHRVRMMPPPKADKMETIVDFGVAVQNLCATIQVCRMDERFYNVALLQELVDSLPSTLKMNWAFYRKQSGACTLLDFNEWLGQMVEALSQVIRPHVWTKSNKLEKRGRNEEAHIHLHSATLPREENRTACLACSKQCEDLNKCSSFLNMTPSARWTLINQKKICRKCLTKHFKTCDRKIPCDQNGCSYLHHPLLHDDSKHARQLPNSSLQNTSCNTHHCSLGGVLLKYIRITVHGKEKSITTYAFLDSGSTSTLMEHSLWEELNLNGEKTPLCMSWTGGQGRYEEESVKFAVDIAGSQTPTQRFHLSKVHTVRSLDLPSQSIAISDLVKHYGHLSGLPIASYAEVKPRILLGVDNTRLEYPLDSREGSENQPTAVLTRLGWLVYGPCSVVKPSTSSSDSTYSYHICQCDALNSTVKNYFSLDSLGVQLTGKSLMSKDDERAMTLLQSNTKQLGRKFETGLLWRYDDIQLPDSKPMALKHHECLAKRLVREPELAGVLQEKIADYKAKGYIRKLSKQEEAMHKGRSWYLPIFPVVNLNKPGKLRMVWDTAAKVGRVSLNSFLLKGPDQVTPLPNVLQRFREYRIAVSGDIREMFHQVQINNEDQHCQRFLWNDGILSDTPTVYIMQVMTFGASCSPSSAQYVKNLNAGRFKNQFPEAVEAICNGTYVDDMLYSVESEEEAVKLAQDVRFIHAEGGFEIRGWLSNSKKVIDVMGDHSSSQKDLNKPGELATEKVLGMWWDTVSDTFTFKIPQRCKHELLSGQEAPTKREVLRILMSVYDPIGLLANVLMFLKVLLQDIWRSNVGWDEPIADQQLEKWRTWLSVLHNVETVSVPRCYRTMTTSSAKSNEIQLHVFVDASENGYAAVAYFRYEEGNTIECAFVTAKTRVAPLKYVSIPRLELQAAVIGTRLAKAIGETHRIAVQKRFFWTDSRDVLCWLRSDHRKYSKYVGARVGEILENSELSEWFWVPTKMNVADEGTKWQRIPDISPSSRWFNGPFFMWQQRSSWPPQPMNHGTTTTEINHSVNLHAVRVPVINFAKYSSWRKLVRVVAYMRRFYSNIRARIHQSTPTIGILKHRELSEAENYIQAQLDEFSKEMSLLLRSKDVDERKVARIPKHSSIYTCSPFLDDNGVLRMLGRAAGCQFIQPGSAHPILLPNKHPITTLIVRFFHERYHHLNHETAVNELCQKYRIPKLRRVCYKVRQECQTCMNARARPRPPVMADLPLARLAAYSRPFSYAGVDYFGPMQVVVGRRVEKRWGVLITCLVVRAVHIEIAHTLNSSSCIMALRNFMARRGTPLELFSDRGTNFVGANRELTEAIRSLDQEKLMQELETPDTKWTFLPPSSPHMGGSWERLVQSVKKVLNNMKLPRWPTDEVLRNSLMEVENILNSRPLTYVPIADVEHEAITPNHFLLGSSSGSKPLLPYDESLATLSNSWKTSQTHANLFWKRWLREYLPSINRRTKWHYPAKPIQIGDVVVIVDPDLPRNTWPKGRVVDVKLKDGQVRSATVRTTANIFERPAVKLAVLDVGATANTQEPGACVSRPSCKRDSG
ncbi:uncharacterized protein LOC131694941 [Topomyia yanbarensis]|uniref:uncharacterized protein LOC131694941 n=1 Tax=Topomyia yanbarensis TaxID=2498891 RepID=UPI00273B4763|nr:uncharacterized protein LOC131694941 [Topomyia yanbarensis]